MEQEIKPTFSWKYIVLTLLVALVTLPVGWVSNYLFTKATAEKRSVVVAVKSSGNILTMKDALSDKIGYKFFLLSNPEKVISSVFQYNVSVLNNGDVGLEDFALLVDVGKGLSLSKEPLVVTVPEKIMPTISMTHANREAPSMDEWKVSLLNPGERIEFTYVGYSHVVVNKGEMQATLRKKDWVPTYVEEISRQELEVKETFLRKKIVDFDGKDLVFVSIFLGGIFMYFGLGIWLSIWILQWRRLRRNRFEP